MHHQTKILHLSIFIVFLILIPAVISAQLSGSYTIGPSGNYTSFNAAVNDLTTQGISAPVTFQIQPGTYSEHISISSVSGSSITNTVTFQGTAASQCILTYNATVEDSNYIVLLTDTRYIRFQDLTFVAQNANYGRIFYLLEGVNDFELSGSQLHGVLSSGAEDRRAIFYSSQQWPDSLRIYNNEFFLGGYAIHLQGSPDHSIYGTEIYNNSFTDCGYRSISVVEASEPEIFNNTVINGSDGIYLHNTSGGTRIYNNRISVSHYGITLDLQGYDYNHAKVFNNFVTCRGQFGIYLSSNSYYYDLCFNSINVLPANNYSLNPIATSAALRIDGGQSILVRNNNLANQAGGYAYVYFNSPQNFNSDFNNLYSPGNSLAYAEGKCPDLAAFQYYSGQDLNSVSVYPHYQTSEDLHSIAPWLDEKAEPITEINMDIDGDLRDANSPDIGADEFVPDANSKIPLSSDKTIGIGGDYTSINDAVYDLQLKGISAPITFNILSGNYNEQVHLVSIPGADASNTVTFQSASGNPSDVHILYSSSREDSNFVWRLFGSDDIEIKDLTLSATGSNYATVLELWGRADSIKIINNSFNGINSNSYQTRKSLIYSLQSDYRTRLIQGNIFNEAAFSIFMGNSGAGIIGNGLKILDNVFTNEGYGGIFLIDHHSAVIDHNNIQIGSYGIDISGIDDTLQVTNNRINMVHGGLDLTNCQNMLISPGIISNNFISSRNQTTYDVTGISIVNSSYQQIVYNSVCIKNGYFSSEALNVSTGNSHLTVMNNNFAQMDDGLIYTISSASAFDVMDYNNLYTPGNNIAVWEGNRIFDLSEFRMISGLDEHSLDVFPHYISEADLHSVAPWLDGKGTPITGITHDIDGELRDNLHPDIGADEFTTSVNSTPYAGTLTVGTGGIFSTLNEAVDSLVLRGISDQLILELEPGIYNEQLEILSVPGTSSQRMLTLQSLPGDTAEITYSATTADSNYVVRLKGADHIRLENLKLTATGNTYGVVLNLYKGSHHVDVKGNYLRGISTTQNDAGKSIIYSADSYYKSRIIQNNTLFNGSYGIYMRRQQNNFDFPPGTSIRNNYFNANGYMGIYLQFHDAPVIEGNTIESNNAGIQIPGCTNNLRIQKNKIDAAAGYGLYLSGCNASNYNRGLIANNFIHVGGTGSATGINLTTTEYYNVYYNSVNVTSTSLTNNRSIYVNSGNNLDLLNNIFRNSGGGYALFVTTPTTINSSDYNDWLTNGTTLAYWNGAQTDLPALQTASGMESHSISADPVFQSDFDLHAASAALDSAGFPTPEVTSDIDGQPRDLFHPDIGADEFGGILNQIFVSVNAGLTGLNSGSASWADYDNDQDLDILITGTNGQIPVTLLYQNNNNSFDPVNSGLPDLKWTETDWGDFDNDGDLDLVLSGNDGQTYQTDVYQNDGSGNFTSLQVGFPAVTDAPVEWGDYDNDGDLDILFIAPSSNYSDIYRNNGNGNFTPINCELPGGIYAAAGWGDYDNDGDLDVIVCGQDTRFNTVFTELYRNDAGIFVNADIPFTGVAQGSAEWGDYDNDGDLDLLLTGRSESNTVTLIYLNDGNGNFSSINPGIPALINSSTVWGDYDNDGDLDILVSGYTTEYHSEIYQNNGGNTFSPINAGLMGLSSGSAAWGDFDDDNDLDILLIGYDGSIGHSLIYRNTTGTANSIPSPPSNLHHTVQGSGIILNWDPAVDAETPQEGLSYNLRIGTTPGGSDVKSPMALSPGWRKIVKTGNVQQNIQWVANGLTTSTTYYWSVQALDHNFAGSGFSAEDSFTYQSQFTSINAGLPGVEFGSSAWGDYDNDGDLDILMTGRTFPGNYLTEIFQNNGNNSFTSLNAGLPGVYYSSVDWGDFDNDNDLDIILTGYTGSDRITDIFQNNGNGTFSLIPAALPGVSDGNAEWGDYDLDGDQDILLAGNDGSEWISKIYENTGNGNFVDIAAGIPGYSNSMARWQDIDNDRDLDIIISGMDSLSNPQTSVYKNDGNGNFWEHFTAYITSVYNPSLSFGDYDGDGDPDLLITGNTGSGFIAEVNENLGLGYFRYISAGLPEINSSGSWGDYDNDGDLDILLVGDSFSDIFQNNNGVFTQTYSGLPDLARRSCIWGDYDNDGDLDLFLSGWDGQSSFSDIYENHTDIPNSPPDPPVNLNALMTVWGAFFYWDPATDAETPDPGLSYNLRVGTSAGGSEIISPMSGNNGQRKIVESGNINQNRAWLLKNLTPNQTYYWSVQTLDNNFEGSVFTPESSFVYYQPFVPVGTSLPPLIDCSAEWGDFDNDNDLDLVIAGDTGPTNITEIYRNEGNGVFVPLHAGLIGVEHSSVIWGDYDNDEDLDLLLTGAINQSEGVTRLYRNVSGYFVPVNTALPDILSTSIDFGDYDNDGDLDIFLSGQGPDGLVADIYQQVSSNTFAPINSGITPTWLGEAKWGDYDNDGDLDLLVTGEAGSGNLQFSTEIYNNQGNGTFLPINHNIPDVRYSSAAWGDYDNDGDLDILLSGDSNQGYFSEIYKNQGSGSFVSINAGLPGPGSAAVSWGDYDNDGDLDFLLSGYGFSEMYRNSGNDTFIPVGLGLPGVGNGFTSWGDYDNDGDLDFLLMGQAGGNFTQLYQNNHNQPNTPPTAPSELIANVQESRVILSWLPSTDTKTDQAGLTYNLRVGTTPGGSEIMSAMSHNSGFRKVARMGNVQHNNRWMLTEINQNQTYYWTVQALDNNFAGSEFATEGHFSFNFKPTILFIKDVPDDQGGQVRVRWRKSDLDDPLALTPITSYAVWRKIPPLMNPMNSVSLDGPDGPGEKSGYEIANDSLGYYDFIATIPAVQAFQYNYIAPTLEDSSAAGVPYFTFVITAHTAVPSVFFVSESDSGYSVDNLSPSAPRNLAGDFNSGAVSLHWQRNVENDLRQYLLYRSLTPDIDPTTDTSFATITDTVFVDNSPPAGGLVYYIVCAEDIHDNISEASNEISVAVTGIYKNSNDIPTSFNLYQNFPNPFNPHTTVQFDLPRSSHTTLRIYNSMGELVETLVNKSLPAGRYQFYWTPVQLASGIYFYTIQTEDFRSVKKMILMK